MKTLTQKQEQSIKDIESEGDSFLNEDTFDSCLSAIDKYVDAQAELYRLANDQNIPNAKPYPSFNSSNVSYKAWYAALSSKMAKANAMLVDPKIARR